jgi:mRNA-degrading endonuclease RelE of RelBE toxin-antitoxin system
MAYHIEFSDSAIRHLKGFSASQRSVILDAIEQQLMYEPLIETRNRKLLRPNRFFAWELRIGELRVFYTVDQEEIDEVQILAIGWKPSNTLYIDGEEVTL